MASNMHYTQHSRMFSRDNLSGKMKYLCPDMNDAQTKEALLLNHGFGGLCFQAREPLNAGSRLQLFFAPEAQQGQETQAQSRLFLATVRWCQELESAGSRIYNVGASFLYNECEWCGQIVPYEQLWLESQLILCQNCSQELHGLNKGQLKMTLFNHLLGNVL
ncbi:MAG: hypothetical protein ACLFMR_09865 [Desulfohalobiaceae bacterium]